MNPSSHWASLTLTLLVLAGLQFKGTAEIKDWMPNPGDRSELWWKDGFPGLNPNAPWKQCVRTGRYGAVLDVEKIAIPHLGPLNGSSDLEALAPAELALEIGLEDKYFRCVAGGEWTRHTGPRLIESGRFLQRFDVTNLVFEAEDGSVLNTDARLEVAAWPDRLSLILHAIPGPEAILPGRDSFGKEGGGFGLDGTNHLELSPSAAPDSPAFTITFWTFLPKDYRATDHAPWLMCRDRNELADGNVGIVIERDGISSARLNIGGGRGNAHLLWAPPSHSLRINAWNHLALTYDGDSFRYFVNGKKAAEKQVGQPRTPSKTPLTFGRRQDNSGTGYYYRGVVDDIQLFDRSLNPAEIQRKNVPGAIGRWGFLKEETASESLPRIPWKDGHLEIRLRQGDKLLTSRQTLSPGIEGGMVTLALDPDSFRTLPDSSNVRVEAKGAAKPLPVGFEPEIGWHRIQLNNLTPISPKGDSVPTNDALERVALLISNPSEGEQVARLLFEKTAFRNRIGSPITGISALLRDAEGNPTGIPVQLSKNWHHDPLAGAYAGQWFHGISQVQVPPQSEVELELVLAYGHWGGVPAASHAQLSLIGWGANQRWDQSALGSWGESICYEPDQIQGKCTITDVRPLMVRPMDGRPAWGWTNNVGGGDFFRLWNPEGTRLYHQAMKANYIRTGPCLTEVVYSGNLANSLALSIGASLGRTDDIVRGTYTINLRAEKPVSFSRAALFQMGADTYNQTSEQEFAIGHRDGLEQSWRTTPGGNVYQTEAIELQGEHPWVSLHQGSPAKEDASGAWANRGFVIRDWKAKIAGKPASPWIREFGLQSAGGKLSSIVELVPPPGASSFEPGDFIQATIEYLVIPQSAEDYYGPNPALREALQAHGNTWKMIHREAQGNSRKTSISVGTLVRNHPDIRVATDAGKADFTVSRGIGFVPITLTELPAHDEGHLFLNGERVDQSVHGNDFWQTDFDPESQTWSRTYNLRLDGDAEHRIEFK